VQPPGHQLGPRGLESEDGGLPLRGQPISQGLSHSMNKMNTYLYKYNTQCDSFRKARGMYLERGRRVEGDIKDRDEDTHRPFEDSEGGDEDVTVSLNTN